MLELVGISRRDEELYRFLLREPEFPVPAIAARLSRDPDAVVASLHRLEDAGLVTRISAETTGWRPVRPDVAVELLVTRRQAELSALSSTAREWVAEMAVPHLYRPEQLIEVVVGQQAIAARFTQLVLGTQAELLVLDRPPYASKAEESDQSVRLLLGSGVRVRGIYSSESLQQQGAVDEAYSAVDAGEESRTHPLVPMKLAVSDRREALLPLAVNQLIGSALIVHSSALLDALVQMFELLWEQALPVAATSADGQLDTRLLTRLTAGFKDEAIARQLGVSTRTVSRRVADLMGTLGARTRFQAGVHAERRRLFADTD